MTDEQLMIEWNKIATRKQNGETITREVMHEFKTLVQKSHDDGEITWSIVTKYAGLMCGSGKRGE